MENFNSEIREESSDLLIAMSCWAKMTGMQAIICTEKRIPTILRDKHRLFSFLFFSNLFFYMIMLKKLKNNEVIKTSSLNEF